MSALDNYEAKKSLVIIGAGGHGVSLCNVALSAGFTINCFIDINKKKSTLFGYPILGELQELKNPNDHFFAIAIGDNFKREVIYRRLIEVLPGLFFPPLIHSSAIVSSFSNIGEGSVLMPKSVIGPNSKVGKFCIVNTQASIDHDCTLLNFSSLGPAAITGGEVEIGFRSAVCIGATVKNNVKIGDDSVIGAHSYLNKDLQDNQIAYGIPARKIRKRTGIEKYLK